MPDKKKDYMDYDFNEFRQQMAAATFFLKEMNEAATYMRWQWETDEAWEEFEKEMNIAKGWLSSWCG